MAKRRSHAPLINATAGSAAPLVHASVGPVAQLTRADAHIVNGPAVQGRGRRRYAGGGGTSAPTSPGGFKEKTDPNAPAAVANGGMQFKELRGPGGNGQGRGVSKTGTMKGGVLYAGDGKTELKRYTQAELQSILKRGAAGASMNDQDLQAYRSMIGWRSEEQKAQDAAAAKRQQQLDDAALKRQQQLADAAAEEARKKEEAEKLNDEWNTRYGVDKGTHLSDSERKGVESDELKWGYTDGVFRGKMADAKDEYDFYKQAYAEHKNDFNKDKLDKAAKALREVRREAKTQKRGIYRNPDYKTREQREAERLDDQRNFRYGIPSGERFSNSEWKDIESDKKRWDSRTRKLVDNPNYISPEDKRAQEEADAWYDSHQIPKGTGLSKVQRDQIDRGEMEYVLTPDAQAKLKDYEDSWNKWQDIGYGEDSEEGQRAIALIEGVKNNPSNYVYQRKQGDRTVEEDINAARNNGGYGRKANGELYQVPGMGDGETERERARQKFYSGLVTRTVPVYDETGRQTGDRPLTSEEIKNYMATYDNYQPLASPSGSDEPVDETEPAAEQPGVDVGFVLGARNLKPGAGAQSAPKPGPASAPAPATKGAMTMDEYAREDI